MNRLNYSVEKKLSGNISFLALLFCYLFSAISGVVHSQSIQDLEAKLKTATPQEKPAILNQLSAAAFKTDPAKSISYAEQALKASRKVDDVNEETDALTNLGNGYEKNKNQKKAIQYYKECIAIFDKYNQPGSSAYLWNKIADSYLNTNNFTEAIDADTKALELFKKAGDKTGIVNMNIELGDIYFNQGKYESSLPNFKQALKMYEDAKDARGQITILNRIGNSYSKWNNYDEAYIFLKRAYDLALKNNLTSQANAISQSIEGIKKHIPNWQELEPNNNQQQMNQAQLEKNKEQELKLKTKESEILTLADKNIKSLAEIEQLSYEAQLKEFKIKTQQEDLLRKQMEADAQSKANEILTKEKELADSELKTQRIIIWGGVGFSLLGLALTLLVFTAYRNKKKANDLLKQKNDIIYKQKEQIEQKNILITDSIDYAKNIQEAILPPAEMLTKHFPDSFIFYRPKDIVSGDFFWIHESSDTSNDCVCVAAADCTGHGVPGAFMSLLGFIMLDDIARRDSATTPAGMLKEVNSQLMTVLHQNTENTTGKFGMDISLVKFNKRSNEVTFAGAHNPLLIIRDGAVNEIKADRMSIGTVPDCTFTDHTVPVQKGDYLYIYSDGYQDQIGGEKRKKFLAYHLKELFQQIYTLPPAKQQEELGKKHSEWRGKNDQTDDILIIGFKV